MFANHEAERPIVVALLLLQSAALLGAAVVTSLSDWRPIFPAILAAALIMVGSLALYMAGLAWARLASVVLIPLLGGLLLPEPFLTTYAPMVLLLAPALAMVLASPAWVVGGAAAQMLLLLWRAGFSGIYAQPLTQVFYTMIIGAMVLGRMVTEQARRRAEEQARLLGEERAHLERRVAERTQELAAANEELLDATRMRDLFLASVSHELRTPLNVILGSVELLREEVFGELAPRQHRSLATVADNGHQLLRLINDILDLAQMESGTFQIDVEQVDAHELCEQCARMIEPEAERKGLGFTLSVEGELGMIAGDSRRLRQVLLNLLSNAVKFTQAGAVGIEARRVDGGHTVEFVVWDTGIGVDPERQRQLFRPFTQLDSRLARQYEGGGLGLALVAQLVARHGGAVGVSSIPGEGSRFWVRLPAGKGEAQPRAA